MSMEMIKNKDFRNDMTKILLYIVITFTISWSIWFLAHNAAVEMLGSCMPSIVGFFLMRSDKSGSYKNLGSRLIGFKFICSKWLLFIFLVIPVITLLSIITQKLSGGDISSADALLQNIRNPASILVFAVLGLGAGFGEELGWRSFLLDTLRKYCGSLTSSLIIGGIWASWHIPLAVMNHEKIFSLNFITYFIFVVLLSVLFTTVYVNNNRSILSVLLLHGMVNFTQYLVFMGNSVPVGLNIIKNVYLLVLVIGLMLILKSKAASTYRKISSSAVTAQKQI